jgi:hypothetical protein
MQNGPAAQVEARRSQNVARCPSGRSESGLVTGDILGRVGCFVSFPPAKSRPCGWIGRPLRRCRDAPPTWWLFLRWFKNLMILLLLKMMVKMMLLMRMKLTVCSRFRKRFAKNCRPDRVPKRVSTNVTMACHKESATVSTCNRLGGGIFIVVAADGRVCCHRVGVGEPRREPSTSS